MVVNNPSNNSSACGGWMGWPSSTSSSANPMSAPVSASCASAVSADLPHTPALPTQAQPLAACSHWKQNIFSSIGKTSLFVIKRVWTKLHPAMHVSAGSFSEDRPLGWDPVAAGNRAGDGMACNNNDRRQWRNQGIVVGAAASKTQAQAKRMLGAATRPRVRRESSPSGDGDKSPLKILTSAPVRVIIHKDNMVCGWFRARNYGAREVFYYGTY